MEKYTKFPEQDKFLAWTKSQALIDVDFSPGPKLGGSTSEEVFAELNKIVAAETVDDKDFY